MATTIRNVTHKGVFRPPFPQIIVKTVRTAMVVDSRGTFNTHVKSR